MISPLNFTLKGHEGGGFTSDCFIILREVGLLERI